MIEIVELCKEFGRLKAVDRLSLSVPQGELFCFLGPNGAGKTTTIKVLTGLLRPTSGRCAIAGIDIVKDPVAAKRLIGYIPDMPFLYERLTASEFFRFVGMLYDVSEARIDSEHERLFDIFDLRPYCSALVKDLSHGLRQRLIYAATLLHEPRVLFIDEPLIGLDPKTIRLIKDLLRRMAREGATIFLTTHILALAEDIADRIGIIHGGRLCALGSLDELRRKHGEASLETIFLGITGVENADARDESGAP